MSCVFENVYELSKRYNARPNTLCLFEKIFKTYIKVKFSNYLTTENNNKKSEAADSCNRATQLFDTNWDSKVLGLRADALVILRLAMKLEEDPQNLYEQSLEKFIGGHSTSETGPSLDDGWKQESLTI